MKKFGILGLVSVALVSFVEAKDLKLNQVEEIEKFYYNKGYADGSKKAYNEGYEQAYRDFRHKLRKYKNRLEAIEAGKYLNKEAKLQYPEVYRIKQDDGTYIVKIVPPKIVGELSLNELAKIPEKYISDGGDGSWKDDDGDEVKKKPEFVAKKSPSWTSQIINSFRGSGVDFNNDSIIYSKDKNIKKEVKVVFEENEQLLQALARSNVNYIVNDGKIIAKFNKRGDYRSFCEENFGGECLEH